MDRRQPTSGPGELAAARRSPCERCGRRDYQAACYRECAELAAFNDGQARDTRVDMEKVAGPVPPLIKERLALFICEKLNARVSARQCILNQGRAQGIKDMGCSCNLGRLAVCLHCREGRQMLGVAPSVLPEPAINPPIDPAPDLLINPAPAAEAGPDSQKEQQNIPEIFLTEKPKTKSRTLPARLKNASPAVRRAYLVSRQDAKEAG